MSPGGVAAVPVSDARMYSLFLSVTVDLVHLSLFASSLVALAAGAQLLADSLGVPAQVVAWSDQLRGDQSGAVPLEHRAAADPELGGELSRGHQRHDWHRKPMFCALTGSVVVFNVYG